MRWVTYLLTCGLAAACASSAPTDRTPGGQAGNLGTGGVNATGGTLVVTSGGQGPVNSGGGQLASGGECKIGHYVGTFEGIYRSQVWGNGDPAFALHVQGLADPILGVEPLEFDLVKGEGESCEANEEFCGGYTIQGGKMMGGADPFDSGFLSVHFEIDLTGELDCRTGEFRGRLENGFYDVFGAKYYFAGDIFGQYDKGTLTFGPGSWDVIEDPAPGAIIPPDMSIGGDGSWEATWVAP